LINTLDYHEFTFILRPRAAARKKRIKSEEIAFIYLYKQLKIGLTMLIKTNFIWVNLRIEFLYSDHFVYIHFLFRSGVEKR
jgi:hypothetical protein